MRYVQITLGLLQVGRYVTSASERGKSPLRAEKTVPTCTRPRHLCTLRGHVTTVNYNSLLYRHKAIVCNLYMLVREKFHQNLSQNCSSGEHKRNLISRTTRHIAPTRVVYLDYRIDSMLDVDVYNCIETD